MKSQDIIDELDPNKIKCCECGRYLELNHFNVKKDYVNQVCNSCYVFRDYMLRMRRQGKDDEADFIQSLMDSANKGARIL